MLVYGDHQRVEKAGAASNWIARLLAQAAAATATAERHALLVRAFIRAGELAQGIADAEFEARGCDALSDAQEKCAALLVTLAKLIDRSSRSCPEGTVASIETASAQLATLPSSPAIRTRRAEGFAHYALYPETYLEAARRSGLGPQTRVIGIRSIGFCLAALVSATLEAAPPISVRPIGHPFRRTIAAAPELSAELARDAAQDFAIVDEGPGLSGSSFTAVAEWLESIGIAPHRIHFFPSHGNGPGQEADFGIRRRWSHTPSHHVRFEEPYAGRLSVLEQIEDGVSALIGPLDARLRDISGGCWRSLHDATSDPRAPCDPRLERRKFLARSRGGSWLVKFAGLDEEGALKLLRARALAGAGFSPEPAGVCYGFLVERWVDGDSLARARLARDDFLAGLGSYLGFRAREFPARNRGATLGTLVEMARCNTREALGEPAAAALAAQLAYVAELEATVVPVHVDGRLHSWEWLVAGDGRPVKTDAVDHSCGHDLIGCQDIAWDVAGAIAEYALSPTETRPLCDRIARESGRAINADLLSVLTSCYLAFQLGLWTLAAASGDTSDADGARGCAERYQRLLAGWIDDPAARPLQRRTELHRAQVS